MTCKRMSLPFSAAMHSIGPTLLYIPILSYLVATNPHMANSALPSPVLSPLSLWITWNLYPSFRHPLGLFAV